MKNLSDWGIKGRGEWGHAEARLTHNHTPDKPFFCYKGDNDNWYCESCHTHAPKEMVWVAKLAGAKPLNSPWED